MKFIVTNELGRLTRWLRALGFDAIYFAALDKPNLFLNALRDERVILTRNKRIGKGTGIKIIFIEFDDVKDQIRQVFEALKLRPDEKEIFTRCLICNGLLSGLSKEEAKGKVPPFVFKMQEAYSYCKNCDKIFWRGTHFDKAKEFLKGIK